LDVKAKRLQESIEYCSRVGEKSRPFFHEIEM
jgi:hypothetical protein